MFNIRYAALLSPQKLAGIRVTRTVTRSCVTRPHAFVLEFVFDTCFFSRVIKPDHPGSEAGLAPWVGFLVAFIAHVLALARHLLA